MEEEEQEETKVGHRLARNVTQHTRHASRRFGQADRPGNLFLPEARSFVRSFRRRANAPSTPRILKILTKSL